MTKFSLKTKLAAFVLSTLFSFGAYATVYPINVTLSGLQEVPGNSSAGTGTLVGTYNDATDSLIYTVTFSGLSANVTAAHFHAAPPGFAAGVLIPAVGFPTGVTSGTYTDTLVLTQGQEDSLKAGLFYFNIHTSNVPSGEIRAQVFLQDATLVVPDIVCLADTAVDNDPGICTASVSFEATVSAGTPDPVFYYSIGGVMVTSPYVFPLGTTAVKAIALNGAGVDSCIFNVTINDTEPPVITCPGNITMNNDPGECGAIVSFSVTATDNCSANVSIDVQPASGSFFPVGVTTVTATATDDAGNTSTCSFTVTVNDVEPPVIRDLVINPPILWPPNHKMKNVLVDYTSVDNCPGPISCEISVTSNEPENGLGDGDQSPDWQITDDHHIKLRAERSGTGNGRVYTIHIACTDQYGNTGTAVIYDTVPKNLSQRRIRQLVFQFWNPGNGHGNGNGNGHRYAEEMSSGNAVVMNEWDIENSSLIRAYPNPSSNYFSFNIQTNNPEKLSIRLIDVLGRVVDSRRDLSGSQIVQMGNNLRAGMYIAEFRQGEEVRQIKLIKQ